MVFGSDKYLSYRLSLQVWDFTSHLNALAESEAGVSTGAPSIFSHSPLVKFSGHKDEGYSIDWSPVVPGRLVSGTVSYLFGLISFLRILNQ